MGKHNIPGRFYLTESDPAMLLDLIATCNIPLVDIEKVAELKIYRLGGYVRGVCRISLEKYGKYVDAARKLIKMPEWDSEKPQRDREGSPPRLRCDACGKAKYDLKGQIGRMLCTTCH